MIFKLFRWKFLVGWLVGRLVCWLVGTQKTRETKMLITQNFDMVWPIRGRTMWKLTSWRFRKCGTFWDLKVLNQSYWLSKFGRFLTSLTFWSSLLKTWKTRETKTRITQNFELVWPIQGRTMWKLTSWGFQKCGSFRDLEVLNPSYRLSKSGQIQKKNRRYEKKIRPQYWVLGSDTESAWDQHGWFHADSMAALKTHYCGRIFFS